MPLHDRAPLGPRFIARWWGFGATRGPRRWWGLFFRRGGREVPPQPCRGSESSVEWGTVLQQRQRVNPWVNRHAQSPLHDLHSVSPSTASAHNAPSTILHHCENSKARSHAPDQGTEIVVLSSSQSSSGALCERSKPRTRYLAVIDRVTETNSDNTHRSFLEYEIDEGQLYSFVIRREYSLCRRHIAWIILSIVRFEECVFFLQSLGTSANPVPLDYLCSVQEILQPRVIRLGYKGRKTEENTNVSHEKI